MASKRISRYSRPSKFPGYFMPPLEALETELLQIGISPLQVRWQPIQGTKMHRFLVISPGFSRLRYTERQELLWRIFAANLQQDRHLQVVSLLAMTPDEAEEMAPAGYYPVLESKALKKPKTDEAEKKRYTRVRKRAG